MGNQKLQPKFSLFESVKSLVIESGDIILSPFLPHNYRLERRIKQMFTPMEEAIAEIKRRRQDPVLQKKVSEYLNGDIPAHFNQDTPIFYLSRYVATPNYEAIHVAEMVQNYDFPLVIGIDMKGKFTPRNELKRALGKLPVTKGYSHNKDEIIEYFTIIDFDKAQGKKLSEIQTIFGESLVDFHHTLYNNIFGYKVRVGDETDWVDRNFRHDIFQQYKRMWALMCVNGIMLESYVPSEYEFTKDIVLPTFNEVCRELDCKPLVVEHIPAELEVKRDWNAYPSAVYQFVKRKMQQKKDCV